MIILLLLDYYKQQCIFYYPNLDMKNFTIIFYADTGYAGKKKNVKGEKS